MSQIKDVNVGAKPDIVGEIPPIVVGILVNHDIVAIPKPIAAVTDIERSDAEIETAEPEAAGTTAAEVPDVSAAEAAGKAAVLPGMIEVKTRVIAALIVTNPFAVRMDMGSIGVARTIVERLFGLGRARCAVKRFWAVVRNKSPAHFVAGELRE